MLRSFGSGNLVYSPSTQLVHIVFTSCMRSSRTLGQCLNATNSSGKNAYRTFLKYLQVSFQLGLRAQLSHAQL